VLSNYSIVSMTFLESSQIIVLITKDASRETFVAGYFTNFSIFRDQEDPSTKADTAESSLELSWKMSIHTLEVKILTFMCLAYESKIPSIEISGIPKVNFFSYILEAEQSKVSLQRLVTQNKEEKKEMSIITAICSGHKDNMVYISISTKYFPNTCFIIRLEPQSAMSLSSSINKKSMAGKSMIKLGISKRNLQKSSSKMSASSIKALDDNQKSDAGSFISINVISIVTEITSNSPITGLSSHLEHFKSEKDVLFNVVELKKNDYIGLCVESLQIQSKDSKLVVSCNDRSFRVLL